MKKILVSVTTLAFVAVVVAGATGAFFSDTETSTGNTFTAGAIDLKIDSEQHYNGNECVGGFWVGNSSYPVAGTACGGTWGQTAGLDIVNEKFFNFLDLKPGDFGENTISLHVENNPAWACANIEITSDEDVTCTEPELKDDPNCVPSTTNAFNGEIGKNLALAWWADDGDNILQSEETNTLFFLSGAKLNDLLAVGGTGNKMLKLTLADSLQNFFKNTHPGGGPLNGSQTYYVGLAWCFGDMDIIGTTITCDGAPVNNESQTDSLTADMTFTVTQARNQDTFRCEDTYKPTPTRTLSSPLQYSATGWGGWSCPAGTTAVGGGVHTPAGATVLSSQLAVPNSVWPHYTFGPSESGWVVQNNGTPAPLVLYVDCLPN